jgi:hypothetical protein
MGVSWFRMFSFIIFIFCLSLPFGLIWCCCDIVIESCEIDSDNFNRGNENPPTGWTEIIGTDWEINTNTLRTSTSNALLKFNTVHPDTIASSNVTVKIYATTTDDELKIIVNYTDSDNFNYALIKINNPNGGIALYERISGSDNLLSKKRISLDINTEYTIITYFGNNQFGCEIVGIDQICYFTTGVGTYVGLGTGTITGEIQFNDFIFNKHKEDNNNCDELNCSCTLIEDEFVRSDSSNLGYSFTQESGSWNIISNHAVPGNTDALLISETLNPAGIGAYKVFVKAKGSSGDKIRIILAYDGTDFYYAEVVVGTFGKLYVGHSVDGILNEADINLTGGQYTIITACMGQDSFTASCTCNNSGGIAYCTSERTLTPTNPVKCGIGTGDIAVNISFDYFKLYSTYSEEQSSCEYCAPLCVGCLILPNIVKATIYNAATPTSGCTCPDCTIFNGIWLCEYQGLLPFSNKIHWWLCSTIIDSGCPNCSGIGDPTFYDEMQYSVLMYKLPDIGSCFIGIYLTKAGDWPTHFSFPSESIDVAHKFFNDPNWECFENTLLDDFSTGFCNANLNLTAYVEGV